MREIGETKMIIIKANGQNKNEARQLATRSNATMTKIINYLC